MEAASGGHTFNLLAFFWLQGHCTGSSSSRTLKDSSQGALVQVLHLVHALLVTAYCWQLCLCCLGNAPTMVPANGSATSILPHCSAVLSQVPLSQVAQCGE
jgi:hypothetical protein